MKKKDKHILWPIYFDSTRSRSKGRRVPRNIAVTTPKLNELSEAAELLDLRPETISDVAHPCTPWEKTGVVIIKKTRSKSQVTQKIAKKIVERRSKQSSDRKRRKKRKIRKA
jgi:signal recognition particle subunit SRP19